MSEHDEQKALIDWSNSMIAQGRIPELVNLFAIPNGGMRNKAVAIKLKHEGVKKGVLDLFMAHPSASGRYPGFFIEMKYGYNKLDKEQCEWKDRLERAGFGVVVCRSWIKAARHLIIYLGKPESDFPEFFGD